jgi:hypothetical protein
VDLYRRVRRAHFVEGMSVREAARMFNLHAVRSTRCWSTPCLPGTGGNSHHADRSSTRTRGGSDRILGDDQSLPKKQTLTAKRICDRLRDEHGFPGNYTIVKDYFSDRRRQTREMFVPAGTFSRAHPV